MQRQQSERYARVSQIGYVFDWLLRLDFGGSYLTVHDSTMCAYFIMQFQVSSELRNFALLHHSTRHSHNAPHHKLSGGTIYINRGLSSRY